MSREDLIILASRTLALLMMVWALSEVCSLPGAVYAFNHYADVQLSSASATQYYRHSHLISLSFMIARILGFSLLSRWLFKGGPEVFELLLPVPVEEVSVSMAQSEPPNIEIR
jgi:hypothetical protein